MFIPVSDDVQQPTAQRQRQQQQEDSDSNDSQKKFEE
jgi:hypothetical protein